MGGDRTAHSHEAEPAGASPQRRPTDSERHPVCADNGVRVGGSAACIRFRQHLRAPIECVVAGWNVGTDLAHLLAPTGRRRQPGVGASVSGQARCARDKRGDRVGKTNGGKGAKVMVGVDGDGAPIGVPVDSAQPHDITLAEPTLPTIAVPRRRGRPTTRPKALVADKASDSAACRRQVRRRGITPTIPTFERHRRKTPKRGRPLQRGAGDRQRWNVERWFGWMDQCRRWVVRDDRHVHLYRAVCLVAIILWCVDRILK